MIHWRLSPISNVRLEFVSEGSMTETRLGSSAMLAQTKRWRLKVSTLFDCVQAEGVQSGYLLLHDHAGAGRKLVGSWTESHSQMKEVYCRKGVELE